MFQLKRKLVLLAATTSLLGLSASTFAADGTINFTGKFVDTTCNVQFENGNNTAAVDLGSYSVTALAATNDLTTTKPIKISLSDCPAKNNAVNIEFTSNNTNADGHTYIVTGSNEISKTDIGVALFTDNAQTSQIIPASTQIPVTLTETKGDTTVYASFKRIKSSGTLTADEVSSTATFNINYL
ncbi:fimbrial protein [Proteus sp. G2669]|uniref:fimbrial protein n=1 Tax=unclassified Proteus (in: enterobacteria) TaxID=257482 RepID=UPI001411EE1F|nr:MULTISPECIES: fimbrial protein [unclassified Proteus (in: enterobacteria)]NBM55020.1 fimbrial protein [Proteus sp. G2669]UDN37377.1 type 1 fimbrial protein [Proteus sp. NMG38-2]